MPRHIATWRVPAVVFRLGCDFRSNEQSLPLDVHGVTSIGQRSSPWPWIRWKPRINVISSASSVFLVHNLVCNKCISEVDVTATVGKRIPAVSWAAGHAGQPRVRLGAWRRSAGVGVADRPAGCVRFRSSKRACSTRTRPPVSGGNFSWLCWTRRTSTTRWVEAASCCCCAM